MPSQSDQLTGASLVTRSNLANGLANGGVCARDTLLVHTSLSRLGFVPGAAQTVVEALIDTVGPDGTIAMPTYSGEHSDPAEWRHPLVPKSWIEPIRREMPAYDQLRTPTRKMGVVAEYFRHTPGAHRSQHPQSSFTAVGKRAGELVASHPLDFRFGPQSPLGTLFRIGGKVLMLGAPPQTCSFFYLSQHYMTNIYIVDKQAPILVDGEVRWAPYRDLQYPNDWFNAAMDMLIDKGIASSFGIGDADCFLFEASPALDAVVEWRLRS